MQLSAIDEHAGAVASASHSHVSSRFQFRLISGLVIAQFRKACPSGCLDARDVIEGERQLASCAKRRRMGLRTYGKMRLIIDEIIDGTFRWEALQSYPEFLLCLCILLLEAKQSLVELV